LHGAGGPELAGEFKRRQAGARERETMIRIRWEIDGTTRFAQVFDNEAAARAFLEAETNCTAEDLADLFSTGKTEDHEAVAALYAETKVTTPWISRPDFGAYFRLVDGNLRGCPMLANGDPEEESETAIDLNNPSTREVNLAITPAETATLLDVYRDLMLSGVCQ
jgi:hypothetical protein